MSNDAPGATPETTPPGATPTTPTPAVTPPGATPDTAALIRDLETRLANADARIKELNKENRDYRIISDAAKAIGATPEALKATVEAYAALGKPDELKTLLDNGKAAIQERDTLSREKAQNEAAALLKLKPSALSAKWLGDGVPIIEGEGEASAVFIQTGDAKVSWDDFVKENGELADVLPALQIEGTAGNNSGGFGNAGERRVAFPRQAHGDQKPAELSFEQRKQAKLAQSEYPTF